MDRMQGALLVSLLSAVQLWGQSPHWESLDGPYWPEQRTQLRFSDGDRRYYGVNTGTFRTTNEGKNWSNVGAPATSPYRATYTLYQSPGGAVFVNLYYLNPWPHSVYVNRLLRSTDRGEHWISTWGTYNGAEGARQTMGLAMAFGGGDTVYISYWYYQYAISSNTAYVLRSTEARA